MSRLDYRLRHLLQKRSAQGGEPERELPVRVLLRFKGDLGDLKSIEALGFKTTSVAGEIAAGFASHDVLERISSHPNVISIESSRPLKEELDTTIREVQVSSLRDELVAQRIPCRGEGVIVGVIDSGFDFTHPTFCTDTGRTRILAFWDQTQALSDMPQPPPGFQYAPPQGFNYGVEYTQELIDAALEASNPSQIIPHIPSKSHGTRVASIAAGNGAGSPAPHEFIGMAPKADLIFVCYASDGQLGDSASAVDAINYVINKAKDEFKKPVVINLSQGDSFGAHDGTSLLERAIESHLETPGISIVKSAGDEAKDGRHASGRVIPGREYQIEFEVTEDHDEDIFDIWYGSIDRFYVSIELPDGTRTTPVEPESTVNLALANGNEAFICSQLDHPDNHDNRINVILHQGNGNTIEHGKWKLILFGNVAANGSFHIWIDENKNSATFTQPDSYWTVTIPGTSNRIIAVGAYQSKEGLPGEGDLLLIATSLGPTRDGRMKPDVSAPGCDVISAIVNDDGMLYQGVASGTSMSAPHVSGVIALLFQKEPCLTQDDIRRALLENASRDRFTGSVPNIKWGYGKVNAEAAYNALSNLESRLCADNKS